MGFFSKLFGKKKKTPDLEEQALPVEETVVNEEVVPEEAEVEEIVEQETTIEPLSEETPLPEAESPSKAFLSAIENRRSYYEIGKDVAVSETAIKDIVEHAVKYTPSAFNSQSARVVVLTGDAHDELWELTKATFQKILLPEAFATTSKKLDTFKSGYGTVLFFEDYTVVEELQQSYELYAENFPVWSNQSSGMLQLAVWTALEAEGLGASLQHYNPIIDAEVLLKWQLPATWRMIAQLPFGNPTGDPGEKTSEPIEDRVKVLK